MLFLWQSFGFRPLMLPLKKTGGRNNTGRICVFHRGGGCKRKLRLVDFKRSIFDINGVVKRIEYDPNRNCFLALIFYSKLFLFSYILLPEGLRHGDSVLSSMLKVSLNLGNATVLSNMLFGVPMHNIEIRPGKGGQLFRAAGSQGYLSSKMKKFVIVSANKLRSLCVFSGCLATVGQVSNVNKVYVNLRKAGVVRLKGRRPVVRGVAMNPIDHPHGGGEGKTSGGRHPVTPWGKLTKGPKTRCGRFNLTKYKFVSKVNLFDAI